MQTIHRFSAAISDISGIKRIIFTNPRFLFYVYLSDFSLLEVMSNGIMTARVKQLSEAAKQETNQISLTHSMQSNYLDNRLYNNTYLFKRQLHNV